MVYRITLDQISTQNAYNLTDLYNNEFTENDDIDSPYTYVTNMCNYYEPAKLKDLTKENSSLSLFCLNTQGLRAHWDAFNNLVENMNGEICTSSIDVIGITELYSTGENECSLNGYQPLECNIRNDLTACRWGCILRKIYNTLFEMTYQYSFHMYLSTYLSKFSQIIKQQ